VLALRFTFPAIRKESSINIAISGRRLGWCSYGRTSEEEIFLVTPNRDLCLFGAEQRDYEAFRFSYRRRAKAQRQEKEIRGDCLGSTQISNTLSRLVEVWPEKAKSLSLKP
jgi:hypothetical protein